MDSDLARVLRQIEELLDDDIDGACSELKRVRFLLKLAGAHRPGGRSADFRGQPTKQVRSFATVTSLWSNAPAFRAHSGITGAAAPRSPRLLVVADCKEMQNLAIAKLSRSKLPWHQVFMEGLVSESFEQMTNEGENTHAKPIAGEIHRV
jgi:hypothetical protein